MKERLQQFMAGRYGVDDLSRLLSVAAIILLLLGLTFVPWISSVGLALIFYNYFRAFSKNISARSQENAAYLKLKNRIAGWFSSKKKRLSQRKEYRFYKCSSCKKTIRVPKGKGKIEITCPVCHNQFIKRS